VLAAIDAHARSGGIQGRGQLGVVDRRPAIQALAFFAELLQEQLLFVDVAHQHGEVHQEAVFFLLDDALGAPQQGADQDKGNGQDAEQRDIQPS